MNLFPGAIRHRISHHFQPRPTNVATTRVTFSVAFMLLLSAVGMTAEPRSESSKDSIQGRVVDSAGSGVEGVMVSAVDDEQRKWTSVFTQQDGSFSIPNLRNVDHKIRARLMGLGDEWVGGVAVGTSNLMISTHPAVGDELESQRPASSAFSMLNFDDPRDKMNFKMFCSYCHQVGTLGF